MSSNRFDTSQQYQYVPSHIPLPFEQIAGLGEKIQAEHAAKQGEMDALEQQLAKIKVADQVLSEGSGEDLGIKYRNTGYGSFKNQVLTKAKQANQQLAADYQAGKLDANQFSQKVRQIQSDFMDDYNKLKVAEANSAIIEEQDKAYRQNKQVGMNPFLANQLAAEGSRLLSNPFTTDYKGAPIGEAIDVEKSKNEYADKFQSQILSTGAGKRDANGMIIYSDKSGVTRDRIIDSVNSSFDQDPMLGTQTREQTNRFLRDRGLDWNSQIDINGQKVNAGDYYYNSLKQDFINGVVAKAESSKLNREIKQDWIAKQNRAWEHEDKVVTDSLNLKGNSIPGSTVDILANDPQFKSLSDKGILSVDPSGKMIIDLHGSAMGYQSKDGKIHPSMQLAVLANTKAGFTGTTAQDVPQIPGAIKGGLNSEDSKELDAFITKAAKAVGFPQDYIAKLKRGEIVGTKWSSKMQDIATAYNVLSKSKLGGVQLPSDVQEIETNKIMQSPESYTLYDPVTHDPTDVVLNKGDEIFAGERIYVDGKAYIRATVQRNTKSGEEPITETVLIKPQSKNSSDYFDRGLGSTQKAVMDLFTQGGDIDPKYIEGYDSSKDKGNMASVFARGTLSSENGKNVSYTFVKSNNNLNDQVYTLHTPEGDLSFDDYNEFLVHADQAYYLYGRGSSDATALKGKYKFERLQGSKLNSESEDNED